MVVHGERMLIKYCVYNVLSAALSLADEGRPHLSQLTVIDLHKHVLTIQGFLTKLPSIPDQKTSKIKFLSTSSLTSKPTHFWAYSGFPMA